MANPVLVVCTKGAWIKVATNVVQGVIHNKGFLASYFQTYRITGDPAPTNLDDAVQLFSKSKYATISSSSPIDVYVYCKRAAGRVRVDS